jgi:Uma2 family endonuclease
MDVLMTSKARATIEDLYHVPDNGKAELVNGEIVLMPPTGDMPGSAASNIFVSLRDYQRRTNAGRAYADSTGFRVNLPHRESFSPDAAFYTGERAGMKFLEGAPVFAVEVRSEGDYGAAAEAAMAQKRADYFAAGTLVVWDVDLLSEEVVKVYRASDPDHPTIYRRGEVAEAEPALPGWEMPVDGIFA